MISDEMRELLSAYVDGELPHGEAARVEEQAKRDPRLRRRIQAYRRLSETLQVWDVEEHGQYPSKHFKSRALARVRAYEAERSHEHGGAVIPLWLRPAAIAAGLLLALGLGALAAWPRASEEAGVRLARSEGVAMAPLAPDGAFRAVSDPVELPAVDVAAPTWAPDALERVVRGDTKGLPVTLDGETFYQPSRRAFETFVMLRDLGKGGAGDLARVLPKETRTGTQPNVMVAKVMDGCEPRGTEFPDFFVIRRKNAPEALPPMRAAPAWNEANARFVEGDELEASHYVRVAGNRPPVLTLAGEVWIEPNPDRRGPRVRRSRVVSETTWISQSGLVPMAWGNDVRPAANTHWGAFRAEALVLGPGARRELLGKNGRDEAALRYLAQHYARAAALGGEGEDSNAKTSRAAVDRLVTALEADARATGFAVYDEDGKLLGAELFASHELMMQFAARLLRGYLLESGGRIRLDAQRDAAAPDLDRVREFLHDETPRNAQRIEDVVTWKDVEPGLWPTGMRKVNLISPTRQVLGHGLFVGERMVQLSLFGS